jgi:hypothetical protein
MLGIVLTIVVSFILIAAPSALLLMFLDSRGRLADAAISPDMEV